MKSKIVTTFQISIFYQRSKRNNIEQMTYKKMSSKKCGAENKQNSCIQSNFSGQLSIQMPYPKSNV